jgi:hypothetical protein
MSAIDDFEKRSRELFKQLKSDKPLEFSEETRRLARLAIEKRQRELNKKMTPGEIEAWAKGLVDSMYGKD